MTYTDQAKDLSAKAEGFLLRIWAAYESGQLTKEEFVELSADTLAIFNLQAADLADFALVQDLEAAGVQDPEPVADPRDGETERLALAFATVVAVVGAPTRDPVSTVSRISRAEPLAAAQDTYSAGLSRNRVSWTRQINSPDPCEVCRGLSGSVLPGSVRMYHHPGCGCTQRLAIER